MQSGRKLRILLVKHWMEIHDRGVKSVAARLKDAGYEVIYVTYSRPEEVANAAIQEDIDVLGMSFSTGAYDIHVPKVMQLLKESDMGSVLVVVGGLIPDEDIDWLKSQGIRAVFGAGSDINELIQLISKEVSHAA